MFNGVCCYSRGLQWHPYLYKPLSSTAFGPLAEGSYIYGPSTIYSGHCPLYLEVSTATQRHHEDMKAVMEVGTKICQLFSHDLPSGKLTYPPVSSNMARENGLLKQVIFPAKKKLHSVRGFSTAMFDYQKVAIEHGH